MEKQFQDFMISACRKKILFLSYILLACGGLGLFFLGAGLNEVEPWLVVLGLVLCAITYFIYFASKDVFRGGKFWAKLIMEQPDRILWIKPVQEKTTINHVITVEHKFFEIYTDDPTLGITIACNSNANRSLFYSVLHKYVPNAQLGYSEEMEKIYRESKPEDFHRNLLAKKLYRPVMLHLNMVL